MSVVVTFKGGQEVGNCVEFADDEVILIGSSPFAKLRVPDDPLIATEHAVIERTPDGIRILRDLGSDQGTYLNGKRVQTSPLCAGDVVRCGLTMLKVSFPDTEETQFLPDALPTTAERAVEQAPTGVVGQPGYRIVDELSTGPWSRVYRAIRQKDRLMVVIKEINPLLGVDPKVRQMFRRETGILKSLDHPNIVRLFDLGIGDEGIAWFVMEYIEGRNLLELVKSTGSGLAIADACAIICQVLDALDYAHCADTPIGPLVHRDVKPANILVSGVPGRYRAKLADFGMAKSLEKTYGLTKTGDLRGTLAFMPAEQLLDSKHVGPEVDLYATGCVLYFCLCGRLLYDEAVARQRLALVNAILQHKVIPIRSRRPDLPEPLADAVDRSLAVDPAQRFQTARDMKRVLTNAMGG